jgi:hypothetical protein
MMHENPERTNSAIGELSSELGLDAENRLTKKAPIITKLLSVLLFWRRHKAHEREWYRRQEEAIREGMTRDGQRNSA